MRTDKIKVMAAMTALILSVASCSDAKTEVSDDTSAAVTGSTSVESTAEETVSESAVPSDTEETTEAEPAPTWADPVERTDTIPIVQISGRGIGCSISVDEQYAELNESLEPVNALMDQDVSDIFVTRCDNRVLSFNYRTDDLNVFYADNLDVEGIDLILKDVVTSRQDVYDLAYDYVEDRYSCYFTELSTEEIMQQILNISEDKWYMDVNSLAFIIDYTFDGADGHPVDKSGVVRIPYTLLADIMNPNYAVDPDSPIIGEYSLGEFIIDDSLTIDTNVNFVEMRNFIAGEIKINDDLTNLNESGYLSNSDCRYVRDQEGNDYFVIYRSADAPDAPTYVFRIDVYSIGSDGLIQMTTIDTDDSPSMVNNYTEFNALID